ncbi:MAG: hypothetical protein B7Y39_00040 [Bdellovibrio sp. 28-41-41]|nr:MAG: hypothetical protein B7Y39_00040 [Bdellovibrio sp. 28-41-41]
MKTPVTILLFCLQLSLSSLAQSFYCVLKTKAQGHLIAPTLVSKGAVISNGALSQYLVQTHSPATILGLEANRLDYKKAYSLDFKSDLRGYVQFFRVNFTKSTGLVVTTPSEGDRFENRYEFIEAKSNPSTISISHRNGWTTEIACMPN